MIYPHFNRRDHPNLLTLQWRNNGHDDVSNHQPHDCLLCRRRSKKTSKLRVTGLCAGNSPVTGEFPAQMASNAENASIWWRHHDIPNDWLDHPLLFIGSTERVILIYSHFFNLFILQTNMNILICSYFKSTGLPKCINTSNWQGYPYVFILQTDTIILMYQ